MDTYECRYCPASFGIAGEITTDEDWAAQDYYAEQVRFHESRLCRHRSTPQSVLDAPTPTPETVSAQRGFSRAERRHGVYAPPRMSSEAKAAAHAEAVAAGRNTPAVATRVRKVRRGRKARFNH